MQNVKNKFYFLFILVIPLFFTGKAQSYGSALGLRFGNNDVSRTIGISYKHRLAKHVTLEGIAQSDFNRNTTFHALAVHHQGFLTKRFNIYFGTGFYTGVEESEFKDPETKQIITTYGNTTFGADLVVGIEFTLLKHNFSFDYKPNFNLVGRENWYRGQMGFTARSVIVKGSTQNKNRKRRIKARKKRKKQKEKANKNSNEKSQDTEKEGLLKGIFKKTDQ